MRALKEIIDTVMSYIVSADAAFVLFIIFMGVFAVRGCDRLSENEARADRVELEKVYNERLKIETNYKCPKVKPVKLLKNEAAYIEAR